MPVSIISTWAQPACNTVDTVVCWARARSARAFVVSADMRNESTARGPGAAGAATSVGVSKPSSTERHAACAASRSCPASQVTKLRYDAAAGSRCRK